MFRASPRGGAGRVEAKILQARKVRDKVGEQGDTEDSDTFRSLRYSSSHICMVDTCRVWSPNCSSALPSHVHCSRLCGPCSRTG